MFWYPGKAAFRAGYVSGTDWNDSSIGKYSAAFGENTTASAMYSDDGPEFDPTILPEVDTSLPLAERPIGGLGIHFIRRTMHTFTYERRVGRNVVRFGRALQGARG